MKNAGFTLIELVVTVMIVAILAAGAVPMAQLTIQRNQETELKQALRQIREAIDLYKKAVDEGLVKKTLDQSGYPPSLEVLEEGVINQKDTKGKVIKFIRKIPRDPMNKEPDLKPAETWAKRS
jgi:general secretion pathway protein G